MEHENKSEGQVKRITVGLILSWVVGVILVVAGIGFVMSSVVAGLLVLLGGLIMLPPVGNFFRTKTNVHLSGGVRFIIAIILFAIGAGMATSKAVDTAVSQNGTDTTTTVSGNTNTATAPTGSEKLELISFKCSTEYGFSKITGEVKNISGKSMDSVVAVGSFYTKSGEFVKSSDAVIDYNPILAGQTSPFQVITSSNPEMDGCKIAFKEFFGGTIPTKKPASQE